MRAHVGPILGLTLCSWDTVWNDAAFLRFSFTPDLGGSASRDIEPSHSRECHIPIGMANLSLSTH
jgi:hypothetical protein